ncbi:MAG: T9SS C-terminal target domain-containing protein [Candidatus Zixiibacteriota bacterium]|nr:MAG: T9SS C-terminal target domain-containing protein [candidate division Zixibacteria bacterium]
MYYNLTLNPGFVSTIYGDFHLTAGSACIDAGYPVLPLDPDQTPNDQGALYYFQTPILVTITSPWPIIMIPGGGGSFPYQLLAENQRTTPQTFDVWTEMRLPDSSLTAPLLLRQNLALPGGGSIQRSLAQSVPGYAPSGFYDLIVNVGDHPDSIVHADSLPFMKLLGGEGGAGQVHEWSTAGWDDPAAGAGPLPRVSALKAHPNPFNPETVARYELRDASHVTLRVFDTAGREVRTLVDGWREAGTHATAFDASGLPAGVYLLRLEAGGFTQVQKLILLK